MNLVNAEWTLTYDNTKLAVDTSRSTKLMPNVKNEVTNIMSANGKIKSNFTEIQNLADFSNGKALARVYFNVIGTGDTTVDFNLSTLSVGYLDSNYNLKFKPVVRGGVAQTDVTSTPGFENFTIKTSVKAAKATTGSTTTVYFAAPKVAPGKTVWSDVDIYYADTTSVKNSNRIHMKDTGLVVNNPDGDKLKTTTSGEWHVFSAELTEAQVKAIDSAKYAGFVNAGNYNLKTSVKFDITMGKSIADFDGQVFLINAALTDKEVDSYTGAWSKAEMKKPYKATTLKFAVPTQNWSGGAYFYYGNSSVITSANKIAMKDSGKTISVPDSLVSSLKNYKGGDWKVYTVDLTAEQVEAIDKSKVAGFCSGSSIYVKTTSTKNVFRGYNSVMDLENYAFVVTGCTNAAQEKSSLTGKWILCKF